MLQILKERQDEEPGGVLMSWLWDPSALTPHPRPVQQDADSRLSGEPHTACKSSRQPGLRSSRKADVGRNGRWGLGRGGDLSF